jgi:SAM-dependent methyltransferase
MEEDFHLEHRRVVRLEELQLALRFFPQGGKVLEIGAGAGWQARYLGERGYEVVAVDVASTDYREAMVFPVQFYDGQTLPAADETFDVVFSSNVLEHVPHIEAFQLEMLRVLRAGGLAVHVMPSATWRLWTTVTLLPKKVLRFLGRRKSDEGAIHGGDESAGPPLKPAEDPAPEAPTSLLHKLLPHPHGVRGNAWSEFYYFSRGYWRSVFRRAGWNLEAVRGNRLLYSGNRLFGPKFPMPARRLLSRILGSSCTLYVLRKKEADG